MATIRRIYVFLISPSLRSWFVSFLFGGRHSSAMLRGPVLYLVTEISAHFFSPVFKSLAVYEEGERRPKLNGFESLQSLTQDSPIFATISASIHIVFKTLSLLIYWIAVS